MKLKRLIVVSLALGITVTTVAASVAARVSPPSTEWERVVMGVVTILLSPGVTIAIWAVDAPHSATFFLVATTSNVVVLSVVFSLFTSWLVRKTGGQRAKGEGAKGSKGTVT